MSGALLELEGCFASGDVLRRAPLVRGGVVRRRSESSSMFRFLALWMMTDRWKSKVRWQSSVGVELVRCAGRVVMVKGRGWSFGVNGSF